MEREKRVVILDNPEIIKRPTKIIKRPTTMIHKHILVFVNSHPNPDHHP